MKSNKFLTLFIVSICLAVIITTSVFSFACSKPAPQTVATQAPKVFGWKFATYDPAMSVLTAPQLEFIRAVDEKSNGMLKIVYYPGETLLKAKGILPGVKQGVAEIGYVCNQYFPEEFLLSNLWALPGVHPTAKVGTEWTIKLRPYFEKEADRLGIKLGATHCLAPYQLYSPYKPIHTLADLKGLQIRSTGGPWTTLTEALGGIPMTVGAWESYDALVKHTLDVMVHTPGWMFPEGKLNDLAKPGYLFDLGGACSTSSAIILNLDAWNSLPDELKTLLEEESLTLSISSGEAREAGEAKGIALGKASGIEFVSISDADAVKMASMLKPVYDEYVAAAEAKGLPGKEVLDAVMKLKEEWKKSGK